MAKLNCSLCGEESAPGAFFVCFVFMVLLPLFTHVPAFATFGFSQLAAATTARARHEHVAPALPRAAGSTCDVHALVLQLSSVLQLFRSLSCIHLKCAGSLCWVLGYTRFFWVEKGTLPDFLHASDMVLCTHAKILHIWDGCKNRLRMALGSKALLPVEHSARPPSPTYPL